MATFAVCHTGNHETAVVSDSGDAFASAEDERDFAGAITNFHFNGRDASARFHAHAPYFATDLDEFAQWHVAEGDRAEVAKFGIESFGDEIVFAYGGTTDEIS